LKNLSKHNHKPVGIIGCGHFATAIANLVARNTDVVMYIHRDELLKTVQTTRICSEQKLSENISLSRSLHQIADKCDLLFFILPSAFFKSNIQLISQALTSRHIIVHGTKGLDINWPSTVSITTKDVRTMSELIIHETGIDRVACISGPNLAKELARQQPTGTVLASKHTDILSTVKPILQSHNFAVSVSNDILGTELCGVLKNPMAIAMGCISGLGYGLNTKGFIMTHGFKEMIQIGQLMGAKVESFLSIAGIGDMVATCFSTDSRNYNLGHNLATGQRLQDILADKSKTIEGINTVNLMYNMANSYELSLPITVAMYDILFHHKPVKEIIEALLNYPNAPL